MLDVIIRSIVRKLDEHAQEVRAQRVKIERERAGGEPRKIATAILKHPEGYATSPREAAESAQKAYAKARAEWELAGIPMLSKLATLAIARERRDETAAALRDHEETQTVRKATKVHPDFRRLNDAMIAHGVQTGHAATATDGVIAIVSDILMWAGADPDMLDPDSPLPAILDVYGTRLILTPGQSGERSRSRPGVPVRQVKYTDPEYYMFNEVALPAVAIVPGKKVEAPPELAAVEEAEPTPAPIGTETVPTVVAPVAMPDRTPAASAEPEPEPEPAPAPSTPSSREASDQPISAELAQRIAEAVFNGNPFKLGIYWPKNGYPVGDYEPARLIPALEKAIEDDPWDGWMDFLAAARRGQASEFIKGKRRSGVTHLAIQLQRGDERALGEARAAGFDV